MTEHYKRTDIALVVDQTREDVADLILTITAALDRDDLQPPSDDFDLRRVTLEMTDGDLAGIPWEAVIANALERRNTVPPLVVRVSQTRPRALQIPLTFPLRVLDVGFRPQATADIHRAFRGAEWSRAIEVGVASESHVRDFLASAEWPRVDILQWNCSGLWENCLSTTARDAPGTAGWLEAIATQWQTRLIIIQADQEDLPRLRRMAHLLVARGGPAVWVSDRRNGLELFYDYFVHDRPLDYIRGLYRQHDVALFAGGGREEALRFSAIGEAFSRPEVAAEIRRASALPAADVENAVRTAMRSIGISQDSIDLGTIDEPAAGLAADVFSTVLGKHGYAPKGLRDHSYVVLRDGTQTMPVRTLSENLGTAMLPELGLIRTDMKQYVFEDHESEGVLPLAKHVRAVKRAVGPDVKRTRAATAARRAEASEAAKVRHVNSAFYDVTSEGVLEQLPESDRLVPGKVVHFGVQIGPKNELITTFGSTALVEEVFRWRPDSTGGWIEIGVTPLDFENRGDAVQQLWLPAGGEPTELVTFALRPRHDTVLPGVARLRFSIYYKNSVVQSYRVAAVLETATDFPVPLLSKALDLTMDEIENAGNFGYAARLEYANIGGIDEAPSLPARTLSIVANESAGQKVVTMKADDHFTAVADDLFGSKVENARLALKAASQNVKGVYRYLDENRGDEEELADLLFDMATAGWNICSSVMINRAKREALREKLDQQSTIVQIANIDITKVIPWSLMYDREIQLEHRHFEIRGDPASEVPVKRGLCRAGIPDSDGVMPPGDCTTAPGCLLDPDENAARRARGEEIYCPESVVCPRRFWGFKYEIEMPGQQVKSPESAAASPTTIKTGSSPQVFAAFNRHLRFAKPHETALRDAVKNAAAALIDPLHSDAALIRDVLTGDTDANVIYFYCHGRPGRKDAAGRNLEPALDFGQPPADDGLTSVDFDGADWSRAPLVFMNGCDTAGGFNPNVPAELIRRFIAGRKASAVIGTEVTIWELLAGEMAKEFLSRFLTGSSAGAALLGARRALLAKLNPLGLVYSLYGSADLTISRGALKA